MLDAGFGNSIGANIGIGIVGLFLAPLGIALFIGGLIQTLIQTLRKK